MARLIFTTTVAWEETHDFGCASLGLAGKCDNDHPMSASWPIALDGTTLTGTYDQVRDGIVNFGKKPLAAIILFGNAGGENQFLDSVRQYLPCPVVGGGAAIDSATNQVALITGRGEVAVFLITDERFSYSAETKCIHDQILEKCTLELDDPRTIRTINGMDPVNFLAQRKRTLGIPESDFEHLTLSDERNVNAHLSLAGGKIVSGRDLQENMILRYVPHDSVYDTMFSFYNDPSAIIFGCAGLSGLLDRPLSTDSLGLFLFGEVCTVDGFAEFGNLMLSKLRICKK